MKFTLLLPLLAITVLAAPLQPEPDNDTSINPDCTDPDQMCSNLDYFGFCSPTWFGVIQICQRWNCLEWIKDPWAMCGIPKPLDEEHQG
ncbi:hypothetical protein BJ508DRAFT_330902 [Ascobolus immersus RN42]|uniref:CBM1 domain-containing protein n=1 Tax=Ascobolus immersus RN42 TaxID=1160509 RepID=A0A3N4HSG5_ASCIM|nr:hypothetical protein BJ508DRAFT_330902 [Ascobolus immersus RN42]